MKSLNRAIKFFGSQSKLAAAVGVEPMSVTHWKTRGVPIRRAIQIEQLTKGKITMRSLCPDAFGKVA